MFIHYRSQQCKTVTLLVLKAGNWGTKAKPCLALPGLNTLGRLLKHCFSQETVTLYIGKIMDLEPGVWQGARTTNKAEQCGPLCKTQPGNHNWWRNFLGGTLYCCINKKVFIQVLTHFVKFLTVCSSSKNTWKEGDKGDKNLTYPPLQRWMEFKFRKDWLNPS